MNKILWYKDKPTKENNMRRKLAKKSQLRRKQHKMNKLKRGKQSHIIKKTMWQKRKRKRNKEK